MFRIALARWLCLTLSNFMHLILPNATDSPTRHARANARVLWALASLFALASDSDDFNSLYEHIHSDTQTLCKYITQYEYTVSSQLYNTQVPVPTAEGDGLSRRVQSGIRTVHRLCTLHPLGACLPLAARSPVGRRARPREHLHGRSPESAAVGGNRSERPDPCFASSAQHTSCLTVDEQTRLMN